jgi:hypothetical protein
MGRRRKREPKRNVYCLRLTDRQQELLKRYTEVKDLDTEVDALRRIIDGLEDFLARHAAASAPGVATSVTGTHHSPQVRVPSDGERAATSGPSDEDDASLGDFGGIPSVLPRNWEKEDDPPAQD